MICPFLRFMDAETEVSPEFLDQETVLLLRILHTDKKCSILTLDVETAVFLWFDIL